MIFRKANVIIAAMLSVLGFAGLALAVEPVVPTQSFASAPQVESTFREQSFILGDDTKVANVRALDWSKDHYLTLPFWLGTGAVVPPSDQPAMGKYYVISEAYIVRSLGGREWLIRAGSQLQKPDAVLLTKRTRYTTTGVILPTIVEYTGTRSFTRDDGSKIDVPVLEEVSLPAKWTLPGQVPTMYARFMVHR
jgi:hypothetical protein